MFFTASDLTFTIRHIHSWALFPLWLSLFIPSGVICPPLSCSIMGHLLTFEVHQCHVFLSEICVTRSSVSYLFVFSYCSWHSPGKNTGVGCHVLLQCMKGKVKVKLLSHVQLLVTPWTAAYQAPQSMGFSRQKSTGVGCHFLLPSGP